jgi:hypothetical protein
MIATKIDYRVTIHRIPRTPLWPRLDSGANGKGRPVLNDKPLTDSELAVARRLHVRREAKLRQTRKFTRNGVPIVDPMALALLREIFREDDEPCPTS